MPDATKLNFLPGPPELAGQILKKPVGGSILPNLKETSL
jgi:hypothetical protein